MDLRQLKYFVQIAESGNFSRAAEVLGVAQPSLSQQMRNLEDELGVELLARHARGVTPTELGQQLCDHARRILLEVDRAKEALRSRSANPSGRVSVGLPTSACRGLSLSLFQALAERQPNITLHLVEAMTGYLDELIQAGRLDVALLYDHKAFEHVAWSKT
jgi:LysR family nitrogen assimilation transcriptional regulator